MKEICFSFLFSRQSGRWESEPQDPWSRFQLPIDKYVVDVYNKTKVYLYVLGVLVFVVSCPETKSHTSCDTVSFVRWTHQVSSFLVYYESINRELKIKPIYECRCDGRLQTKRFTCLSYTGLVVELEHLKIKTRLIP
jgi:hypothetical protein